MILLLSSMICPGAYRSVILGWVGMELGVEMTYRLFCCADGRVKEFRLNPYRQKFISSMLTFSPVEP